jgi:hypothetical protein
MRVLIKRTRMAMPGNFYAYDAYVPVEDCPQVEKHAAITILWNRREFFSLADAIRPAKQWQMEKGWERYKLALEAERQAKVLALELGRRVFPELEGVHEWPTLWVEIPELDATHDQHWVRYDPQQQ